MYSSPPMLFLIPLAIIAQVRAWSKKAITPSMEEDLRIGCVPLATQCGFDISGLAAGVSIDTIMDDNEKSIWPCICLGEASAWSLNKCIRSIEDTGLSGGISLPNITDEWVDNFCESLGTPRTKRPGPPTPSPTLSPTTSSDDVLWYILGGVGGTLVVIALFVICWRRWHPPPPPDDKVTTEMTSL